MGSNQHLTSQASPQRYKQRRTSWLYLCNNAAFVNESGIYTVFVNLIYCMINEKADNLAFKHPPGKHSKKRWGWYGWQPCHEDPVAKSNRLIQAARHWEAP